MSVFELLNSLLGNLIDYFAMIHEENHEGLWEPLENDDGTPRTDVDDTAVQLARKLVPSFKQDQELVKIQMELKQDYYMQEGDPHLVLSSFKPPPTDETVEVLGYLDSEPIPKYNFVKGQEIIQIVPLYPNIHELPDETGDILYDVLENEVMCVFHKRSTEEHSVYEIKADVDGYRVFQHV